MINMHPIHLVIICYGVFTFGRKYGHLEAHAVNVGRSKPQTPSEP